MHFYIEKIAAIYFTIVKIPVRHFDIVKIPAMHFLYSENICNTMKIYVIQ